MSIRCRWLCVCLPCAGLLGCESPAGTEGGSVRDRQDSALKDPFSYGPAQHDPKKAPQPGNSPHPGDGTAKSEWDRFWNP